MDITSRQGNRKKSEESRDNDIESPGKVLKTNSNKKQRPSEKVFRLIISTSTLSNTLIEEEKKCK